MFVLDESGNDIDTCLFESLLSKFIIEHPVFYTEVLRITNTGIKNFIEYNTSLDNSFKLFVAHIFVEFNNEFPDYKDIDMLIASSDMVAYAAFQKLFFEVMLLKTGSYPPKPKTHLATLSELAQLKIVTDKELLKNLRKNLRSPDLFAELVRRGSVNKVPKNATRKLGITTEINTPQELGSFFKYPYKSAQLQYSRPAQSNFVTWLGTRNLPFISGASGTIEILFTNIIKIVTLTPAELKCYFMAIAAALVARGHHSFFESIIVISKLGFSLNDRPSRKEFYEQFLTKEVLSSNEYGKFINQQNISNYFTEYDRKLSLKK